MCAILLVRTLVFPDPAPATIRSGPLICKTASFWDLFKLFKSTFFSKLSRTDCWAPTISPVAANSLALLKLIDCLLVLAQSGRSENLEHNPPDKLIFIPQVEVLESLHVTLDILAVKRAIFHG